MRQQKYGRKDAKSLQFIAKERCACVVYGKREDVDDEEDILGEKRMIRQCSRIIKEAYKLTRQVDLPI